MLTEAEKEARRIRRILANRESARLAIRKKQAIYVELKRKAADALEENENLKKGKELALKEYASLKQRNEFLKAQMAKTAKARSGETQVDDPPKRSIAGTSQKQPSLTAYLWPSLIPYSTQNTHGDMSCGPGIPFYFVPVPCLVPVVAQSCNTCILQSPLHRSKCSSDNSYCVDTKDEVSIYCPKSDIERTKTSMTGFTHCPKSSWVTVRNSLVDDEIPDLNVVPSTSNGSDHGLIKQQKKNTKALVECSTKMSENAYIAAEARRRRKELMKMKEINSSHTRATEE